MLAAQEADPADRLGLRHPHLPRRPGARTSAPQTLGAVPVLAGQAPARSSRSTSSTGTWARPSCSARGTTLVRMARWARTPQIQFKLDGAHPAGASHHQKIVVIDDTLAFCGGIDMTADRWDTREHLDDDDRRKRPTTRRRYQPWHDATMAVDGAAARALGELAARALGGRRRRADRARPRRQRPLARRARAAVPRRRHRHRPHPRRARGAARRSARSRRCSST